MRNLPGKILVLLLCPLVGLMLFMSSPAAAGKRSDIAEVANELHHSPHSEVTKELQPDRVKPPATSYDGTLESIPGLNLPGR